MAGSDVLALRAGLVLIALSCLLWAVMLATPAFAGSAARAAAAAGALFVASEVAFWAGVALAGKPAWGAVKARGWRQAPRELWRMFARGRVEPAPGQSGERGGPAGPAAG
ncbi:MAG TPA: transporter suffix domain-containing protein [Polyangiaceae bacterium]|nr:transporter suffix domain-containing protein [Polyangiaceae bacterium]